MRLVTWQVDAAPAPGKRGLHVCGSGSRLADPTNLAAISLHPRKDLDTLTVWAS